MATVVSRIASCFQAYTENIKTGNSDWEQIHREAIEQYAKDYLPSGSGFNVGTTFDFENSREEKLIFHSAYQYMSDHGYYDGWTEFEAIVTPSLAHGFSVDIVYSVYSDEYKDLVEDFLYDSFYDALRSEVKQ